MEGKTVTVIMPEGMYRELTEYVALLSAKPLRSGRTRTVSPEHALVMAAMLYIEEYLYQQKAQLGAAGRVSCSPPDCREGSGVGPTAKEPGRRCRVSGGGRPLMLCLCPAQR